MTLTPMTIGNYVTNEIVITFPADAVWTAAITSITVDGLATEDYTVAVSDDSITFGREVFPRANSYSLVVSATGYDDSTCTQVIQIALWGQLVFYDYETLKEIEPVLLSGLTTLSDISMDSVMNDMRNELYKYFQHYQSIGERTDGTEYFVLDHMENPTELRRASVYFAIAKIMYRKSISDKDQYMDRFKHYNSLWRNEIGFSKHRLTFDTAYIDQQTKTIRFSR